MGYHTFMSLKQFKWLDLLLFSIVAIIFEAINRFAAVNFSSFKIVFMSFTIVLTLISMYRWGISGIIVLIFASIVSILISDSRGDYQYYVTYVCGGVLGMLPGFIIFQLVIGRKRIKNTFLIVTYLLFDFAMVILFRSLISSLFNLNDFTNVFVTNLQALAIQESMSIFTSIIILLIANRKKGNVVVEMNNYVKEVHELKKLGNLKELKEKPNFNSDGPFTEADQIDESTILDGGTMNVDQLKELSKMYEECDKIPTEDPIDCLAEQEKKEQDV